MRHYHPTTIGLLAFALFFTGLGLGSADAQVQQDRVQRRYDRVAKGKNVEEWHKRLSDKDAAVRLEAVASLGKAGTDEAIKPLIEATADVDERVRLKALDFLGIIGNPRATPALVQSLFLNNIEPASKLRALIALGRIKDPRSANPLMNFAKNNVDEELRTAAVYALGEIGVERSLPGLEDIRDTTDSPKIKRIAADAIGKINRKVAVLPNTQPTMLEMEKFFRAQAEAQQKQGGR